MQLILTMEESGVDNNAGISNEHVVARFKVFRPAGGEFRTRPGSGEDFMEKLASPQPRADIGDLPATGECRRGPTLDGRRAGSRADCGFSREKAYELSSKTIFYSCTRGFITKGNENERKCFKYSKKDNDLTYVLKIRNDIIIRARPVTPGQEPGEKGVAYPDSVKKNKV
ncbi:hypothetical protein EVAR_32226_1 [Eumeta japonica]|uniref:Uncharacterized protein n=1 Tax=Eumeta variegata TaxID=151549 RepID=A0A4C1YNP3_EUMVA|nr:hypothetical protein EVAR_32226_1 [Eumeta japonica]